MLAGRVKDVTLVLTLLVCVAGVAQAQVVPGYTVEHYAYVTDPVELAFDPSGVLYVGRDNSGSGGGTLDATYIHRVGVGGAPVTEFGTSAIHDPDTVLVDTAGLFVPAGSVLVAGVIPNQEGAIHAILPDESVVTLFGPGAPIVNPNYMLFDGNGRLLLGEDPGSVLVTTGAYPTTLITMPSAGGSIEVDGNNNIYTRTVDGVIRIYDETGALVDNSFATGFGSVAAMAFGPGNSLWGDDLYTVSRDTGELFRIDSLGNVSVIGTGFPLQTFDLEFGPDGYMYLSLFGQDEIVRVVPEPSVALLLIAGALLIGRRR